VAVPYLRLVLVGLSSRRPWVSPRSVRVRFVEHKWHWDRFSSEWFVFLLSVLFRQCFKAADKAMLLRQSGERWTECTAPSEGEVLAGYLLLCPHPDMLGMLGILGMLGMLGWGCKG
jgi:hypothetical protein